MDFATKFIANFHNLEGLTIGERKRNLYCLLNESSVLHNDVELLDLVTSQLQPGTHLEQLFWIEYLIHFRRYEELKNEFVKGNDLVIKRVKKQSWFFQKLVDENFTEIIPLISYGLTLKLLNRIVTVLSEQQGDELFDVLLEHYGILLASRIITSCSSERIKSVLTKYPMKLSHHQLKLIFHKDPNLIDKYFQQLRNDQLASNPIFKYVAEKDLETFQDLCQKFEFRAKLSRKTTEQFIHIKRKDIINHPELYVKHLNVPSMIKMLGSDFNHIYEELFPRRVEDSPNSEASRLLKLYPKKGQYNLMVSTYNKIFAKKLDESPHLIDEHILEMIPDAAERERLARIKSKGDLDPYLKFLCPENCFKAVKEKINFARYPYERAGFVSTLVCCCIINNDYITLLEVSKYVAERFKNDNAAVLEGFVRNLLYQKCDFNQLTEAHWNEIKKIIAKLDITYRHYTSNELFFKYIEFLVRMDKPVMGEIENFFKKHEFSENNVTFFQSGFAFKIFLCNLIELVSKLNNTETLDCKILAACRKLNLKHPKFSIYVFKYPRLLQSLKEAVREKTDSENPTISSALELVLCSQEKNEEIEELRRLLWTNMKLATPFIMKWFLKYRPDLIQENLEGFLTFSINNTQLNRDKTVWNCFKNYSHLNIDKRCIEFCVTELTPLKCVALSQLMEKRALLELTESIKNDGSSRQFNNQKALIISLKSTNSPALHIPLLLKFSHGDYLQLCLRLLYHSFNKAPKNCLKEYLDILKHSKVGALKKIAYQFMSLLFDKTATLNELKHDAPLDICYKYFLINPCKESWELFINKLASGNKDSPVKLKAIAFNQRVPVEYRKQHFEMVWTFLHEHHSKHKDILMKSLQKETLLMLNSDFLKRVIEIELFKGKEINTTIVNYLIVCKSNETMDIFYTLMKNYKTSPEFSNENIKKLITTLYATYMSWNESDENFVNTFTARFQEIFPVTAAFEEYVMITLMKFKSQSPQNLASSIIELHNYLLKKFGETITEFLAHTLKRCLSHFYKTNLEFYRLYCLLLNYKKSTMDVILVIKLLPLDSAPEDKDSVNYYEKTLTQIEETRVASVQVHLNLYFKYQKIATDVSYYQRINQFGISTSSWLSPGACKRIGYIYF